METTKGLVSVIVPVYKVEAYLADTVSCLLNQTYRNLEIILVDDGSPDRCGEMCDEYARQDDRVKVIHKANGGQATARNAGNSICTGEYIVYLDSDDVISEDCVEYLWQLLTNHAADMACCMIRNYEDGESPVYDIGFQYPYQILSRTEALRKFFYMNQFPSGVCSKLFRATLKDTLFFPEGIYYEDVFPPFQSIRNCDSIVLGKACKYGYRQRGGSTEHRPFSQKHMSCVNESAKVFDIALKEYPNLRAPAASRFLSTCAHIFFKIPSLKGYETELQACWSGILRTRWTVLKDPHARKKAWFCALLSLTGMRVTHWLGRKFLYH